MLNIRNDKEDINTYHLIDHKNNINVPVLKNETYFPFTAV